MSSRRAAGPADSSTRCRGLVPRREQPRCPRLFESRWSSRVRRGRFSATAAARPTTSPTTPGARFVQVAKRRLTSQIWNSRIPPPGALIRGATFWSVLRPISRTHGSSVAPAALRAGSRVRSGQRRKSFSRPVTTSLAKFSHRVSSSTGTIGGASIRKSRRTNSSSAEPCRRPSAAEGVCTLPGRGASPEHSSRALSASIAVVGSPQPAPWMCDNLRFSRGRRLSRRDASSDPSLPSNPTPPEGVCFHGRLNPLLAHYTLHICKLIL